jgi:ribonuclease P protein component
MAYTFHKSERLCSKKLIAQLFVKGNRSFSRFPFRFTWVEAPLNTRYPAQVLFVVSKRNFPHSTDRNKVKRKMRELFRLNKSGLYNILGDQNRQIALSVIYLSPAHIAHEDLLSSFTAGLNQLCNELEKHRTGPLHIPHQGI